MQGGRVRYSYSGQRQRDVCLLLLGEARTVIQGYVSDVTLKSVGYRSLQSATRISDLAVCRWFHCLFPAGSRM